MITEELRIKCLAFAQEVVLRSDRLGVERMFVRPGEQTATSPPLSLGALEMALLVVRVAQNYERYLSEG
jgi:hypothetical protein